MTSSNIEKQGQISVRSDIRIAITSAAFLHEVRNALGMRLYMTKIHPAVLSSLRHTTEDVSEVASQSIRSCSFGLPVTLKQTVFPLMRSLVRESSKYVIHSLVGLCVQYGEQVSVQHIIPSLRLVLRRFTTVERDVATTSEVQGSFQGFPSHTPRPVVALDALGIIEALLVILPRDVVVRELLEIPNNEIVDVCFRPGPLATSAIRIAATRVLALMCHVVELNDVKATILAELAPLCAFAFPNEELEASEEGRTASEDPLKKQGRQVACILHAALIKVCDEQTMRASLARQHCQMIEREALMNFNESEGDVQNASQSRALLRMRTVSILNP